MQLPAFVFFGVDGYSRFNDASAKAALVDGREISVAEWDQAHKAEVDRMSASIPGMDVAMFDTPAMKFMALERIIRSKVLEVSAAKLNIKISDQKLATAIGEVDSFASLKNADGSFDIEKYKAFLSAQGMTPEIFESRVRSDLSVRQVIGGVGSSSFSPPSQAATTLDAFLQQREIQVAIFSASDYLDSAKPSDEDIKNYFTEHAKEYQTSETVDIEYVVEEKSSDQIELSGGYGGAGPTSSGRIIGTLGLTFNNFSAKNDIAFALCISRLT